MTRPPRFSGRSASMDVFVRSGVLHFILDLADLGEESLEWAVLRVL